MEKEAAPRNRTLRVKKDEEAVYASRIIRLERESKLEEVIDRTINQDINEAAAFLPKGFIDLLIIDPPYNMDKQFNSTAFTKMDQAVYASWLESWLTKMLPLLKKTASVYICSEWGTSPIVQQIGGKYLKLRNRITWEREKGRGALSNWKNTSEDILFFTASNEYTFNARDVMMKRKVIAPYRDDLGAPKDWEESRDGKYRTTYPSNLWTDITVPFWSMPENTCHPTQKPEKLIAKLILASSNRDDIVFDPFLGSGTTSGVAKKLGRHYIGVEIDRDYCLLAEKRLALADTDKTIQGYHEGVFWERNTFNERIADRRKKDILIK